MKVIIDRFEDSFTVCEKENREMINIERVKIPAEAKEGDVLIVDDSSITIDKTETEARREEIKKLMDDLWQ